MIERWIRTQDTYYRRDVKRVYYLSLEFLMGRTLGNSLINMGLLDECTAGPARAGLPAGGRARGRVGRRPRQRRPRPPGRVLPRLDGHAGLRRRTATASATTTASSTRASSTAPRSSCPTTGCGTATRGRSPRPGDRFRVQFFGRVQHLRRRAGPARQRVGRHPATCWRRPYDTPVPGYGNETVNTLRLWAARAVEEFDLHDFNDGDYVRAVEARARSENISRVLYPNDNRPRQGAAAQAGVLLRLAPRSRTSSAATRSATSMFDEPRGLASFDPSRTRSRSSSTTPTPRSRSRS